MEMPKECDRDECKVIRASILLPEHPVSFCWICVRLATHRRRGESLEWLAVMLGWGNVPPRETLEMEIRLLKARVFNAEKELARKP